MDEGIHGLVSGLHASPLRCVLVLAGAGAGALSWLLGEPGASRTVLEATVPYSRAALGDLLGRLPESAASRRAAGEMAEAAYSRALSLRDGDFPVAGVACAAALATDRPRRGEHRVHAAARTGSGRISLGVVMEKGRRDRAAEERLAGVLVLRAAALAAGVRGRAGLGLSGSERLEASLGPGIGDDPLDLLIGGAVDWVRVGGDGAMSCEAGAERAIMPGSFNPLHRAHTQLAAAARSILGDEVGLEISISNVDKPDLTRDEIISRLRSIGGAAPVVVTREARFSGKAELFPGTTFVVGYDTAERVMDPAYHGGDRDGPLRALERVRGAGCRFLVAGRLAGGAFRSLSDLAVPPGFGDLFCPIPESAFRLDISSTQMRAGMGRATG